MYGPGGALSECMRMPRTDGECCTTRAATPLSDRSDVSCTRATQSAVLYDYAAAYTEDPKGLST